jgi:type IX secretion system PorP/SprF family membrane protein
MLNRHLYTFFLLLAVCAVHSQHFQFSQFYAAPTYLNPAFTGANVCSRFTLNYRNQWSGIPGTFTSYQGSIDHSLRKIRSGIGLQFFNDKAGLGSLSTTQVSLLYAYEAKLNKKIMGRGGFSIGSVQRKVDYTKLMLGDQVSRGNAPTSLEGFTDNRVSYFDIGAGVLVYSRYAWAGLAASHLNKPDQSLMNGSSPLPTEVRLHAGYKFILEEAEVQDKKLPHNNAVTFSFNYKKQQKFNQIDAGLYYSKSVLVLGIWYRGIPLFKPEKSYSNNDAVIVIMGFTMDKYRIGYSYDFTVSKLNNANTKGSHEISMSYQFCNLKKSKKKKNQLISCPKF